MPDKAKRSHIERLVYVSPDVEPGSSLRYGDWQDKPGEHVWYGDSSPGNPLGRYMAEGVPLTIVEATESSDYSGCAYNMSNYRVMKRDYPWLVEIYGGHGTQALAYLGRRENQSDALIKAIDSLADYPCLDESDESELETELEWTAWCDYGRREFAEEIAPVLDALDPDYEHDAQDDACRYGATRGSQSPLDEIWHVGCDAYSVNGGTGYVNEQGDSIHFYINEWIARAQRDTTHTDWQRRSFNEMREKLIALAKATRVIDAPEADLLVARDAFFSGREEWRAIIDERWHDALIERWESENHTPTDQT